MANFEAEFFEKSQSLKSAVSEILRRSDSDFFPPLSTRVELGAYAEKIVDSPDSFLVGARSADRICALYVGYANAAFEYAFSPFMWVEPESRTSFIGLKIHMAAVKYIRGLGMRGIRAKTWLENNEKLLSFYKNLGYKISTPTYNPKLDRHDLNLELTFK